MKKEQGKKKNKKKHKHKWSQNYVECPQCGLGAIKECDCGEWKEI